MTREELDKDMIESIEMWLHEIEPKWVEKELAWLEELRTRLLEEDTTNDLEEAAMNYIAPIENEDGLKVINFSGQDIKDAFIAGWKAKEESEKHVPNDLEEAAEKYGEEHQVEYYSDAYNIHTSKQDLVDAVIYGAKTQKEEMLKGAVEGTITCQNLNRYILVSGLDESLTYGDKVRIIIVKED